MLKILTEMAENQQSVEAEQYTPVTSYLKFAV